MKVRTVLVGALAWLAVSSGAFAQCGGQSASGYVCGNGAASTGFPSYYPLPTLFDRGFGSGQGTILNRTGSGWVSTVAPTLGLNGGTGGSLVLNGSTSGAATISVPAAAGSVTFQLPSTNGSPNFVLQTDGAGHLSWTQVGSGTVTSVGLSMPGIFAVTGSPVTTAGTLTASLNTQTANTVWSGPTSGAASAPTFRSLVGADLPTPTTGSLGGVQANNAVSHQWVNAINTSGVPQLSQPAFSDISGTAAGSQLPTPTASTLGGVESYAAVSHQWINQISTSGVPSSTQPAFSDISGNASLGQLPSVGNNTVLSNISGGSATPLANSVSSILDTIGSTQGNVLYRNGSGWTVLSPGSNGQVLTTGGAAANPSWTTVSGTGTVTQVISGAGLTGGPITTTGTLSLASIANGSVLANTSGSSAAPSATAPSSILDVIGSTEGNVLYRGASNWSVLAPGTSGQFLQTLGASSTPQWASAVTSITAGTGLSASPNPITSSGTINLALNNATAQVQTITDPPTVTSTSGVMLGFGSSCHITPVYSGRIRIEINGGFSNTSNTSRVQLRWGTGTAPSNGAALSGTTVGNQRATGSTTLVPYSVNGIVTGLTPGTAYWFDIGASVSGGTETVALNDCNAMEF